MNIVPLDPDEIVTRKIVFIRKSIQDSLANTRLRYILQNMFKNVTRERIVDYLWNEQKKYLFIDDHPSYDYCQDASEFLKKQQGDCEDFVVFNATILKMYDIPIKVKVTDTKGFGYYTHILLLVYHPIINNWISFDGTYRIKGLGGEPNHTKAKGFLI